MIPVFKTLEQAINYGRLIGGDSEKIYELSNHFDKLDALAVTEENFTQLMYVGQALDEAQKKKYLLQGATGRPIQLMDDSKFIPGSGGQGGEGFPGYGLIPVDGRFESKGKPGTTGEVDFKSLGRNGETHG